MSKPKSRFNCTVAWLVCAGLMPAWLSAQTGPGAFAGRYSDATITLSLSDPSSGVYEGKIVMGPQNFPARAHATPEGISGTFTATGNEFPFSAIHRADGLEFVTGGKSYQLKPIAANPLGSSGLATPASQGSFDAPLPGGFTLLGTTPSGRALFANFADSATIDAAITRTCERLDATFDAKIQLKSQFVDAKTHRRGGAVFEARAKGRAVNGWIFAGLGNDNAAAVSVVCADAAAGKEEIAALFDLMPAQQKLQTYSFPDGSGTIDLPPGWTTKTASLGAPLIVDGPNKQRVALGIIVNAVTPTGMLVRMAQQTYQLRIQNYNSMLAMQQQFGGPPPPNPGPPPDPARDMPELIFCPYCSTPGEVISQLLPVLNQRAKAAGQTWMSVDRVIETSQATATPLISGAHAELDYIEATQHEGDASLPMRQLMRIECYPVLDGKDSWTANFSGEAGPAATFERDHLVMKAIRESVKVDPNWLQAKIKSDGEISAMRGKMFQEQMTRQHQDNMKQQQENFNRFEAEEAAKEKAFHDSTSDFIEMIGGTRQVYDSKTGLTQDVDLSSANTIVEQLNQRGGDPGQFVQQPLRERR